MLGTVLRWHLYGTPAGEQDWLMVDGSQLGTSGQLRSGSAQLTF
jgi:hypothetical protein